jgi:hypothetical protein
MMMRAEEYESIDPFVLGVTPFISVERALASEDPTKWNKYFEDLYDEPAMEQTFVRETVGVGKLWTGFPTPYRGFSDPLVSIRPK